MSVNLTTTKLILIEELPQSRVVSTYEFLLDGLSYTRDFGTPETIENLLSKTYNALQQDVSTDVLNVYANELYMLAFDRNPVSDSQTSRILVIFCRDENIYCDLFDPVTPTTELCSIAGGLVNLKQMATSTHRMRPSTRLN